MNANPEEQKDPIEVAEVPPPAPVKKKKGKDEPKGKPGRPKKNATALPIEMHGIVEAPVNPDDLLELAYCNPIMFKKLMKLYKRCDINEIDILFDPTGFKSVTKDRLGKSTIYTALDGKCMNLYYCRNPVKVCIKRIELEKILTSLNKNHNKIMFILKENFRSIMYVIIKNSEYNNDLCYELNLIARQDVEMAECVDDDTDYPVKFKFSSTHFKATVASMKKMSPNFIVQKFGNNPLQLTYDQSKVNLADIYPDGDKIGLKHTLAENELFTTCVSTVYIEPFAASAIGDEVFIAADKVKKLSLTTRLDEVKNVGWALQVKSFTELKNNNRI